MKKPKWTYLLITPVVFLLPSLAAVVIAGLSFRDILGAAYAQRIVELVFIAFVLPFVNFIGWIPVMGFSLLAGVYLVAFVSPILSGFRGGRIACITICFVQWAVWGLLFVWHPPLMARGGM